MKQADAEKEKAKADQLRDMRSYHQRALHQLKDRRKIPVLTERLDYVQLDSYLR